jgi:hypothetical protein
MQGIQRKSNLCVHGNKGVRRASAILPLNRPVLKRLILPLDPPLGIKWSSTESASETFQIFPNGVLSRIYGKTHPTI